MQLAAKRPGKDCRGQTEETRAHSGLAGPLVRRLAARPFPRQSRNLRRQDVGLNAYNPTAAPTPQSNFMQKSLLRWSNAFSESRPSALRVSDAGVAGVRFGSNPAPTAGVITNREKAGALAWLERRGFCRVCCRKGAEAAKSALTVMFPENPSPQNHREGFNFGKQYPITPLGI